MEGANLSGDLENPGRDLGKGTIISVCASFTHYALLFTLAAFAFPHSTLVGRDTVFQDVEFWPGIAVIGISIVGFSAALGSFIGGARVLQALARDEPRRAILLMYIVCELCFFIGDLNVSETNVFHLDHLTIND